MNSRVPFSWLALEKRLLGWASAFLLLAWSTACLVDINHPPGVRYVRLTALAVVLAIGWLEYAKPWYGFYALLLIWPQELVVKDWLIRHAGELWSSLPSIVGGPLAAVLATAFWLRSRATANKSVQPAARDPWLPAFRVSLWVLAASWVVSTAAFYVRYAAPMDGWVIVPVDPRRLLSPVPRSGLCPIFSTLNYVPAFFLGLLLLNRLSSQPEQHGTETSAAVAPVRRLLLCMAASGTIVTAEAFLQLTCGWRWPFDVSPPGGPFQHRNFLAPVLVVAAVITFLLSARLRSRYARASCVLLGLLQLAAACQTGSRNGVFMVLMLACLVMCARASWRKALFLLCGSVLLLCLMFWLPLPSAGSFSSEVPRRLLATLDYLRRGAWDDFLDLRLRFFGAALQIWRQYPVTGSGPNTFMMLTHPAAAFKGPFLAYGYPPVHAHNLPLHLLAELGPLAALSWTATWLIIPACALFKARTGLAVALLLIGLGNVFDVSWYLNGMTTLSVVLIVLFCAERRYEHRHPATIIQPEHSGGPENACHAEAEH